MELNSSVQLFCGLVPFRTLTAHPKDVSLLVNTMTVLISIIKGSFALLYYIEDITWPRGDKFRISKGPRNFLYIVKSSSI